MDLFVTPPRIDPADYGIKTSGYRITSAPGFWDDEITQLIAREHPYIPADRLVVTFKRQDAEDGTAYGFAGITGSPKVSIPIVLKQRQLSPVDVMVVRCSDQDTEQGTGDMTQDQVVPLNEETFNRAMDDGEIGTVMDPQEDQTSGSTEDGTSLRLPFRGRTVTASVLGASPSKRAEYEAALKDKEVLAGFVLNGTTDVAQSWLDAPEAKKTADHKYASRSYTPPCAVTLGVTPKFVKTSELFAGEILCNDATQRAIASDAVSLGDSEAKVARVLIYEDGTFSSAPDEVAAFDVRDDIAGAVLSKISAKQLVRGGMYAFDLGPAISVPAKLASMTSDVEAQSVRLHLVEGLTEFDVYLDRRVKTAQRTGNAWVMPMSIGVYQLAGSCEPPMSASKVAEWLNSQLPYTINCHGGQFGLTCPGVSLTQTTEAKVASALNLIVSNGEALIKIAKEQGHVRFNAPLTKHESEIKAAVAGYSTMQKMAQELVPLLGMPMDKAVKLAASLGDPQGVDAVLSAGFLSEDNISEFAGLADGFEETVSKLARLLLAIRMGFQGDENATMVAMKSLARVAEHLRGASDPSSGVTA